MKDLLFQAEKAYEESLRVPIDALDFQIQMKIANGKEQGGRVPRAQGPPGETQRAPRRALGHPYGPPMGPRVV